MNMELGLFSEYLSDIPSRCEDFEVRLGNVSPTNFGVGEEWAYFYSGAPGQGYTVGDLASEVWDEVQCGSCGPVVLLSRSSDEPYFALSDRRPKIDYRRRWVIFQLEEYDPQY